MGTYAYDIEALPNFLSYTFVDVDDPTDTRVFVTFGDRDDRAGLATWLRSEKPELVGFNSYQFDDLLLVATLLYPNKSPGVMYGLGQKLINRDYADIRAYNRLRSARDSLRSIDLMELLGGSFKSGTLKELGAKLGFSIVELPVPHNEPLPAELVDTVLAYNLQDVEITRAIYQELVDVIATRRAIGAEFGVDGLTASDSTLANRILDKLYGVPPIRSTARAFVDGRDIISDRLQFSAPELVALVAELRETRLTAEDKFRFSKRLPFGANVYRLGIGGLHTEDDPGVFTTNPERRIVDADVSSYYPAIVLELGIVPDHLGAGFLEFYRGIVESRLKAKAAGDKTKAAALKIAVNAVVGKTNSEYFWLYDPRVFLAVTINGQLFLLDLIEKLEVVGIAVISANTDGVTAVVTPENEAAYTAVCDEWQTRTGFTLEFTTYEKYVRRDVNNYLAVTATGREKVKGVFVADRSLKESYRAPIVATAIREFFVSGADPADTIRAETAVLPFCYVFKPAKKFDMVYETVDGATAVPSVNRYYVSTPGGTLVRVDGERRIVVRREPVSLVNDELPEGVPADLDYGYYIAEARKVIDKITGDTSQLPLFALSAGAGSTAGSGADLPTIPTLSPEEVATLADVGNGRTAVAPSRSGFESSYTLAEIVENMGAIPEGDKYRAPCPLHEGKSSRSLVLSEDDDGRLQLHCFGGCDSRSVLAEIESRLDGGAEFRTPDPEPLGELVATYPYTNEFGAVIFEKRRYDPKDFRVYGRVPGTEEFKPGLNGHRGVLYRLPDVLESDTVLIVEGEKDVHTAERLGFVATCGYAGAGKWSDSYSRNLAGKNVVIIPDNDPPGKLHAREIVRSVSPLAGSVRVLELPVADKGDLTDWVEAGGTAEELQNLINATKPDKAGELFEEADLLAYDASDNGNALAVKRIYGDQIWFSGGYGWLAYNGRYWTMGATAESQVKRWTIDTLYRRREAAVKARDEKYEPLIKVSRPSRARINSAMDILKAYATVENERLLPNPGLLNVANGIIDLRTGAIYPHHSSYGFTYCMDIPYIAGATSELWERFLGETLSSLEVLEYLQESVGYTFTGETREEVAYYVYGEKRSGKGTFTETIQTLGKELAIEVPINRFIEGSSNRFRFAGFEKARFIHASESKPNEWLDAAIMKLVSGGNAIDIEYKGKDSFKIRPSFVLWITSNEPPKMRAEDSAAWYRLRTIEFPFSKAGAEDKTLKAELKRPEHLTAVLAWIVEGAKRWYGRTTGLDTPSQVLELTESFRESLDYLYQFLEEFYEIEPNPSDVGELIEAGFYAPVDSVYAHYRDWYEDNGAPELRKNTFASKLRQRLGGANHNLNRCRVRISDPVSGDKKLTRVIVGIKPKGEKTISSQIPGFDTSDI